MQSKVVGSVSTVPGSEEGFALLSWEWTKSLGSPAPRAVCSSSTAHSGSLGKAHFTRRGCILGVVRCAGIHSG